MDERSIPIDIHLKKLLDWLISRRICNREWHDKIRLVREKIGHAIEDMPEHPKIKELLSGAHINYWHCLEIVDLLKDTEKDSRNFFGQYSSQRMTLWKEIASLYLKENIYLGEGAQLLTQAVTYDLPGLKKHIVKLSQIQEDCDKKEKENDKKSAEFKQEFLKACQQLGIDGKHPRKEIISLLDDLPKIYSSLTDECRNLEAAVTVYENFIAGNELDLLPTLKFLISRGNVTTYEWVHGEAPLTIEEPKLDFDDDESDETSKVENVEIDFDIDFSAPVDLSGVELEAPVDIDWGEMDGGDGGEVGTDIDWDAVGISCDVQIESDGVEGGVARDADALSLLDNRKTRNLLLDDLHELECFLIQRHFEVSDDSSFSAILLGPSLKNEVKPDELVRLAGQVRGLIDQLTTGKLHHLQLVKSSPSYVTRLVDNLTQKSRLSDKLKSANITLAQTKENAIKDQGDTQRKLKQMMDKNLELQRQIEKDISARYQNRKVNITGGVQSL